MDEPLSSIDAIPSGWFDARPSVLLSFIETRTAYMQAESRRVIEAYFLSEEHEFTRRFDLNRFQLFKLRMQSKSLALSDLECYAPQWKSLVPATQPPGPALPG